MITMTADSFFVRGGTLESVQRPARWLRGRSRITQQRDELCRVVYDLVEFGRNGQGPVEFHGSIELAGGIPLNVGLPDLVLDLSDGRRVAVEVTSLSRSELREVYGVRGRLVPRLPA
jgi:hypothetical protein